MRKVYVYKKNVGTKDSPKYVFCLLDSRSSDNNAKKYLSFKKVTTKSNDDASEQEEWCIWVSGRIKMRVPNKAELISSVKDVITNLIGVKEGIFLKPEDIEIVGENRIPE